MGAIPALRDLLTREGGPAPGGSGTRECCGRAGASEDAGIEGSRPRIRSHLDL
jgi:hypothetical protein